MKQETQSTNKTESPICRQTAVSGCHFYCQNLVGDVNFSIDEWNKAYQDVKDKSEEIQRLVLDPPPACREQCFDCAANVGARRKKTQGY
jgi:hypothetical protein